MHEDKWLLAASVCMFLITGAKYVCGSWLNCISNISISECWIVHLCNSQNKLNWSNISRPVTIYWTRHERISHTTMARVWRSAGCAQFLPPLWGRPQASVPAKAPSASQAPAPIGSAGVFVHMQIHLYMKSYFWNRKHTHTYIHPTFKHNTNYFHTITSIHINTFIHVINIL